MKYKDIQKLSEKDREKKLKELKMELIKSKTGTEKQGGSKTRNIRKIIARIHTFNNQNKLEVEKK
ncbi:50S ribosomal protein L29 [Candidatus Pacearchaeota archaeon]|nr:50S ribosomal protein L29 [Candidatus Pacearchaeota archaeon]|tara:strand:+ start:1827 stop:2021 length:195 start_codon:yes stop_codon:yes gene_type:complete